MSTNTFTFPDLPTEIRHMIWLYTFIPRVFHYGTTLRLRNNKLHDQYERANGGHFTIDTYGNPIALVICQESRAIALKHLEKATISDYLFMEKPPRGTVYYHLQYDRFSCGSGHLGENLSPLLQLLPYNNLARVDITLDEFICDPMEWYGELKKKSWMRYGKFNGFLGEVSEFPCLKEVFLLGTFVDDFVSTSCHTCQTHWTKCSCPRKRHISGNCRCPTTQALYWTRLENGIKKFQCEFRKLGRDITVRPGLEASSLYSCPDSFARHAQGPDKRISRRSMGLPPLCTFTAN
jgi:hypothetical protein